MKYCNKCNVIIENDVESCPLCGKKVLKHKGVSEHDFPVQKTIKENVLRQSRKILSFIFIVLLGINVILNIIFSYNMIWAPYSIFLLFYVHLIIKAAMLSYKNIGSIVMMNVYMLSIILFTIDMLLGFSGWSVDFVIPLVTLAGIMALVIFLFIKPTKFLNYFIYMLIIASFGMTQLIFLWTNIVTVRTPTIVGSFISLITIIGMLIFGDRKARHELMKRFHF